MMVPVRDAASPDPVRPGPGRADARRNRERVLAAADLALSERGLSVSVEEIARQAGVGVGTVCRHFPTKQALIAAVLTARYEALLADARAASARPDVGVAFVDFFDSLCGFQAEHRALAEEMATGVGLPEVAEPLRLELHRAIAELVARAQEAGTVRTDIGPADVAMMFSGVAHATAVARDLPPVLRKRYAAIVLDGLRPGAASELPGRPLGFDQLRRLQRRREAR
jgi:AcrR family transcriptional regulator